MTKVPGKFLKFSAEIRFPIELDYDSEFLLKTAVYS